MSQEKSGRQLAPRPERSGHAAPIRDAPQRAVQYVRMSTEHQRYSIENQEAVIAAYALDRGLTVLRSYVDSGKSGLNLKGRQGLQRLLSDALDPQRDFDAILVLDVSRWGRFQDPDQAAHYEYICRAAGVRLAYCAENFENDGGMVGAVVKHLKRVMAAEYSRELSEKVTRAKLQQARLGFRQGGSQIYGFRRQLIDEDGAPRQLLRAGQQKGIQTDRVLVVPGPADELAIIRRIFRLYVVERASFSGIARRLNAEGVPTGSGRPWKPKRVSHLIRDEICIGNYIYNRQSQALRGAAKRNPPADWTRARVGEPIVAPRIFREANRLTVEGRWCRHTDKELLTALKVLLKKEGHLTYDLVDASIETPCATTYATRFGSIARAYERIGYVPTHHRWRNHLGGYWTDEMILTGVRRLYQTHGYVTNGMIVRDPDLPGISTVVGRFGSILRCYERAGCPYDLEEIKRATVLRRYGKPRRTRARSTLDPAA